jgi:hypothetical protein
VGQMRTLKGVEHFAEVWSAYRQAARHGTVP